ncbi:unnamed protein product [Rhodiola kirilowii]
MNLAKIATSQRVTFSVLGFPIGSPNKLPCIDFAESSSTISVVFVEEDLQSLPTQDFISHVLWVFGYGSLVWNPGFEYDEKIIGYIKDYRRVFDLACIDHRGTPEHPARTCTLEYKAGEICWGAAYSVRGSPEKEIAAMEYLERRECEYDSKTLVDFYKEGDDAEPAVRNVIVFTSTPDKRTNKYYLGPAPLDEMARQIATAYGPCGNNRDYIFKLEKALHEIGHEEDYVTDLAQGVRKFLGISNIEKGAEKMKTGTVPLSPLNTIGALPKALIMDSRALS